MSKAKRKDKPTSLLGGLWNEFLFTKPFTIESTEPLPIVLDHLRDMNLAPQVAYGMMGDHTDVTLSPLDDTCYAFTIRQQGGRLTLIRAYGTVRYEDGRTLVQGYAQFNPLHFTALLGAVIFMLSYTMAVRGGDSLWMLLMWFLLGVISFSATLWIRDKFVLLLRDNIAQARDIGARLRTEDDQADDTLPTLSAQHLSDFRSRR